MRESADTPQDERHGEAYEPPRVEEVLTPDEIARQVHYAGEITPADTETG